MKLWKILRRSLLTGCILALMLGQTAYAQTGGNDPHYTYTVTFYAGNQGSFNSAAVQVDNSSTGSSYQVDGTGGSIRVTGLRYGDSVTVNAQSGMVTLNDNTKYYVRGIRESGRDNNAVGSGAFEVKSDREYVVAYGIRGNMVPYVVNYQDASGNALAESQTFYGAVGDQPVVAFQYIENYQPQAYNLTKTLSSNEAENVFTFVYQPILTAGTGTTETAGTTGGTAAEGAAGTAGAEGTAGTAGGTEAGAENAGANEGRVVEDTETPQELINLDDEETPLANIDDLDKNERPAGNMPWLIIIAIAAVLALAVLAVYIWKKRLKQANSAGKID